VKELKIKGNSIEEKMASAEVIIGRLARRSQKTVSVLIPCCPIVFQVQDIGGKDFASFISPIDGTIEAICAKVDWDKMKSIRLRMMVDGGEVSPGQTFTLAAGVNIFSSGLEVKVGNIVTFSASDFAPVEVQIPTPTLLSVSICPAKNSVQATTAAIEALEDSTNEILSNGN
jgi:hypothetical protein